MCLASALNRSREKAALLIRVLRSPLPINRTELNFVLVVMHLLSMTIMPATNCSSARVKQPPTKVQSILSLPVPFDRS